LTPLFHSGNADVLVRTERKARQNLLLKAAACPIDADEDVCVPGIAIALPLTNFSTCVTHWIGKRRQVAAFHISSLWI